MKKLVLALFLACAAQAAEVRVMISNGMRAVAEEVNAAWEKKTGNKLIIEFNATTELKNKLAAGAAADAAILTVEATDEMVKAGKLSAGSRVELARGGVGVGVNEKAKKSAVATSDDLKKLLVASKSVVFTRQGASRPVIDKMFAAMGIADAMKAKVKLVEPGIASEMVGRGEADVVLTLISEIMPVKGVRLLGPLPAQHQGYVQFSAAMTSASKSAAAGDYLKYLASAAVDATVKAKGLERPAKAAPKAAQR
jgi:molybdate transport system substrate-binding protein